MCFLTAAAVQTAQAAPDMFFEPINFVSNLRYMGIGMLVIFVIIGVIILATTLVGRMFSK